MKKREISAILSGASMEEVEEIAKKIEEDCDVEILKEPQKTLVMVKVRESIKRSLFYLGELLATECMVVVNGKKGCSVIAGDDDKKCLGVAVIDAAYNAGLDEKYNLTKSISVLKEKQEKERAKLNAQILKSKVNFNVMGE